MRILLTRILLVCLLAGINRARADQPAQWALLVGIDRYKRTDVTSLNYAVADVKSLAATLKTVCHVPEDNVFVLASDQSGDNSPEKNNVAYRLDWLSKHVKPTDTVFFFFSGHGIEMDGNSYLMTWEADPRSLGTLEETGLETKRLQARLAAIKASRLLVLIDACRSDPRSGRANGDNPMDKALAKDLVVHRPSGQSPARAPISATIFACSPGQRSYEWDSQRHGFFTYYLIQGLCGQAADANGQVTVGSLSAYLGKSVGRATERNAPQTQVPWMVSEGDVNGLSGWTLAAGSSLPPPPQDPVVDASRARLVQAQAAYDAGRYALPEGDNAIELARQLLAQDPGNEVARDLVARACQAFVNTAEQATDKAVTLSMYRRLCALFPERSDFIKRVQDLDEPTEPKLVGVWSNAERTLTFKSDGTFVETRGTLFGDASRSGTWVWLDRRQRTFRLVAQNYYIDYEGSLNRDETELNCKWKDTPETFKRVEVHSPPTGGQK